MLKRFTTHTLMALAEASLIALLVVGLIAGTAFAGKGGGKGGGGKPSSGGSGTISAPVNVDPADTSINYGDRIRFDISTTSTTEPWVKLRCYQGGTLVATGSEGYFDRSLDDGVFGLYSGMWTGGAADCDARLTTPDGTVLARTTFQVDA
jgi:hypothetical protein